VHAGKYKCRGDNTGYAKCEKSPCKAPVLLAHEHCAQEQDHGQGVGDEYQRRAVGQLHGSDDSTDEQPGLQAKQRHNGEGEQAGARSLSYHANQ